jgi:hypothetical protein
MFREVAINVGRNGAELFVEQNFDARVRTGGEEWIACEHR